MIDDMLGYKTNLNKFLKIEILQIMCYIHNEKN